MIIKSLLLIAIIHTCLSSAILSQTEKAPICNFCKPFEAFSPTMKEANWPYGKMKIYDGRLYLLYMEIERHLKVNFTDSNDINGNTFIISKSLDSLGSPFSAPLVVKSGGPGLRPAPGTLGICPNGDFITIIHPFQPVTKQEVSLFRQDRPAIMMRSTDKGKTWTETDWKDDKGNIISCLYIQNFKTLASGRSLLFVVSFDRNERVFYYSDDPDCKTWTKGKPIDVHPWIESANAGNITEASVVELPDGTLLATFRRRFGLMGNENRLLYSISKDQGITWADLKFTNVEASGNNGILSYNTRNDRVRLLSCSRSKENPGLFLQTASVENAKRGQFGPRTKIVSGVASGDFGNPAHQTTSDGTEIIMYYSTPGKKSYTAHFMTYGTITE